MKNIKSGIVLAAVAALAVGAVPALAQGGGDAGHGQSASSQPAVNVTLDVRDAPIRDVLTQLFKDAKVDYSIDPAVGGFVTLKLTDQPLETALRLILRSSMTPLTYTKDASVYIVKPRPIEPPVQPAPAPPLPETTFSGTEERHFAVINLTYIDPADLAQLLGIQLIPFNVRGQSRGMGGFGQTGVGRLGGGAGTGNNGVSGFNNGVMLGGGSNAGGTNAGGGLGHP